MKRFYYSILLVALALPGSALAHSIEDLARWSRSDDWRVRYCVPMECTTASPDAKRILEQLSMDGDRRVAAQAFAVYSGLFVGVDKAIAQKAFDRGDFMFAGIQVTNVSVFSTTEFWLSWLGRPDDSAQGTAVRAIGLLNDATVLPKIAVLKGSKNAYVLLELAKACRRLGNDEQYLEVLDLLLVPPVTDKDSIYYRTRAIDCLIETHPERARAAWDRTDQEFSRIPDVLPSWVFAHVTQKQRLPNP